MCDLHLSPPPPNQSQGIEAIIVALESLPHIVTLDIGGNIVDGMGAERMGEYLGSATCPLTALHLGIIC